MTRGQLGHLIDAATLPTVTLQVLPFRGGAHSSMDGGFTLLSFPENHNPEMLFVSYATGSLHIEDDAQLKAAKLRFDRLRTLALGPADSVALVERVRAELDER